MRAILLLLSTAILALAAETTTYKGTYTWVDIDPTSQLSHAMEMTITPNGEAFDVVATVQFSSGSMGNMFKEPKPFTYTGTVTKTGNEVSPGGKMTLYKGTLTDAKGRMQWTTYLKQFDHACLGMAMGAEPEGGGAWGNFRLQLIGEDGQPVKSPLFKGQPTED